MSELWTRWQGHLINGVYPLGRYLGSSDHSGVFLTRSATRDAADIAIKLVPADRATAEALLPRWKRAGGLAHPNLLHLYEWGGCQLEGSPYLYLVMDYADQTLAQLLQSRALTESEAREMLVPVLDALAFLHERGLVQGQLKPANILVRGDRIKLASDTIRRFGDKGPPSFDRTRHDPPEAPDGSGSPAGDLWALGISLSEALTRHPPSISSEHGGSVALPGDLAPAFHEVVARCLSRRPQDRPRVAELVAWATGKPEGAPPTASTPPPVIERTERRLAPAAPAEPKLPASAIIPAAEPEAARAGPAAIASDSRQSAHSGVEPAVPRGPTALIVGAVLSVGLIWAGWHLLGRPPRSAPPLLAASSPARSPSTFRPIAPPVTHPVESGAPLPSPTPPTGIGSASPHPLHQVVPDVPLSARRTIRGHIKVWVRVSVDQDGSVIGIATDRPGPSRYFQRLAQQAAKRWTFESTSLSSRRLQIRFDFSREGTRARAVALR